MREVKPKYGPWILLHVVEYKVYFPIRFSNRIDYKNIRDLTKNNNLNLIHNWVKDDKFTLVKLKIIN